MDRLTVTRTDLSRRPREFLDRVWNRDEALVVTWHGQPDIAIVDIDEYRALVADRERLRQLEQDESLIEQVMAYSDVTRDEAQLRVAEARQNVYALVEQAHERNPNVPPDVVDVLVEEAREAA
ncbi:MAG: type II toxin-antitoxin system prevent-host-death family antitoxin [Chloroflexota bacterium]|nr:type II toxin-antitoxin system prevent-host-death family antitoxin [Chloroflexota bacterium]